MSMNLHEITLKMTPEVKSHLKNIVVIGAMCDSGNPLSEAIYRILKAIEDEESEVILILKKEQKDNGNH